jgi:hypothetical protein
LVLLLRPLLGQVVRPVAPHGVPPLLYPGDCVGPPNSPVEALLRPASLGYTERTFIITEEVRAMSERPIIPTTKPDPQETGHPKLSNESLPERRTDDNHEAEYFAAYRLQLKRMSCPGCGEGDPIF